MLKNRCKGSGFIFLTEYILEIANSSNSAHRSMHINYYEKIIAQLVILILIQVNIGIGSLAYNNIIL